MPYWAQVDVLRYVLPSIAARLGVAGQGRGSVAALKRSLLDLVAFMRAPRLKTYFETLLVPYLPYPP